MNRLLTIEWLKLKHYRPFWILTGLYFLLLSLVCSGMMFYFEYLESRGASFEGITPSMIPFYDFADIWHNITYLATFFKIFLGFVVVISICNEWSFRTIQQNIIDGLDKWEFLASKLIILFLLALVNVFFIFILGLILGSIYSPVIGLDVMFINFEFIPAYFLDVFVFLIFSLFVGMLIKKTGFAIVLLALYGLFIEPIGVLILSNVYEQYTFYEYFPISAINKLITLPYTKYAFQEVKDYLVWHEVLLVLAYSVVFLYLSFRILKTRDVA
ncbi:ABC-2 type transport system permease protein [Catalinimonas alkaloidigena]|uniref:ABC transporter permease n=1 Tax=Catalinimonas alkaloidigena TaxID=1075417 RepID=UPI002404C166|nr:ABC transporter permease [Catalinimonas alkaloidigena]MDF9796155.1 ABC-2 type transport system permease protein [Catalinimonas alkaloidigena]